MTKIVPFDHNGDAITELFAKFRRALDAFHNPSSRVTYYLHLEFWVYQNAGRRKFRLFVKTRSMNPGTIYRTMLDHYQVHLESLLQAHYGLSQAARLVFLYSHPVCMWDRIHPHQLPVISECDHSVDLGILEEQFATNQFAIHRLAKQVIAAR